MNKNLIATPLCMALLLVIGACQSNPVVPPPQVEAVVSTSQTAAVTAVQATVSPAPPATIAPFIVITETSVPSATLNTTCPEPTGLDQSGQQMCRTIPFVTGIPSLSQARQTSGKSVWVNLSVYCAAMGYDGTKTAGSGKNWRCAGGQPNLDQTGWNKVCYNVWGNNYFAIWIADKNLWQCIHS